MHLIAVYAGTVMLFIDSNRVVIGWPDVVSLHTAFSIYLAADQRAYPLNPSHIQVPFSALSSPAQNPE